MNLVKIARSYELDAEKLMRESGGKITQYGYVAHNDRPIEQDLGCTATLKQFAEQYAGQNQTQQNMIM
jgi:hypothetical protein